MNEPVARYEPVARCSSCGGKVADYIAADDVVIYVRLHGSKRRRGGFKYEASEPQWSSLGEALADQRSFFRAYPLAVCAKRDCGTTYTLVEVLDLLEEL